jgi:hypothetical protein
VTLEDLKWNKRIIVTFSNDHHITETIEREIINSNPGVIERDIVYFLISSKSILSNSELNLSLRDIGELIHENFDNADQFKAILIGKDGGIKMKKDAFDLKYIFRLIDSMPMRQSEMKK